MWGSVVSVFTDPDGFEAAMSLEGCDSLTFTQGGRFRARLTQVSLQRIRLISVEESLPRIAMVKVPYDMIAVVLSSTRRNPPIWGGVRPLREEMITLGAGHGAHMRTEGPSEWGTIRIPVQQLSRYVEALTGKAVSVPPAVCRWYPPPSLVRQLRQLYSAAIRATHIGVQPAAGQEAARGLEQQLLHLLIQCLSAEQPDTDARKISPGSEIMFRFEELIRTYPERRFGIPDLAAALGVSARVLRQSCSKQLGMGPEDYLRLRRIALAHRTLRRSASQSVSVAKVAERFGFHHPGRFASKYRQIYSELPSETVRRSSRWTVSDLSPRKVSAFL